MKSKTGTILLLALFGCAATGLLAGSASGPALKTRQQTAGELAYHDHPPSEPLPATLDPAQFHDDHAAFVSYTLAARIADTLYQVPCYCPCRKGLGHESLLDCYTSKHGVRCPTCQREVLFCFLQHKKGKTPAQIREAMAKGKAAKLDLPKYIDHLYSKIQDGRK
jgi:Protein of unknown function with PCYCGC motif